MVTDGNSKVCLNSTLRSTFFGYDRRYITLREIRNVNSEANARSNSSHRNLIRSQRT